MNPKLTKTQRAVLKVLADDSKFSIRYDDDERWNVSTGTKYWHGWWQTISQRTVDALFDAGLIRRTQDEGLVYRLTPAGRAAATGE